MNNSVQEYLEQRYETTRANQLAQGTQFDLTMAEYIALWDFKPHITRKLRERMGKGTLEGFMRSDWGYVLTYVNKPALKAKIMNASTCRVTTRAVSKRMSLIQLGEKQSEESKMRISKALTGKPKTEAHRSAISEAKKGVGFTEDHKAKLKAARANQVNSEEANSKRAEKMKAYWAARRAAKEAGL